MSSRASIFPRPSRSRFPSSTPDGSISTLHVAGLEDRADAATLPSAIEIPVGERWNVHAEYFAILSDGKEVPLDLQYASFGGHVLATENLELGARFGWGLNDTSPRFFANVGVGVRY